MRLHLSILLLALAMPYTPAFGDDVGSPQANDTQTALSAYRGGAFLQAAELAAAEGSADSLALAARAILADAMCGEGQPARDVLNQAEALARQAISLDPNHSEGRLQLAIALSLKARPMSTREAMRAGYGDLAKDLTEAVLRDDPDNAYAHGLMAVWHVEVVRRGGTIGSAMMGASVGRGLEHYEMAARLSPGDASIHWQMARALTALNARKYRNTIEAALSAARDAPHEDALEEVMAVRAERLSEALITLPRREVQELAERLL